MVTPRSALGMNYQWSQYYTNYIYSNLNYNIHTRMQETPLFLRLQLHLSQLEPLPGRAGPGGFISPR